MVEKRPRIIIGAGFGGSGTGVFMDLMREIDGVTVEQNEFRLLSDPDGLVSLEDAMVSNWSIYQGDMAIRRFIKMAWACSRKFRSPYAGISHSKAFGDCYEPLIERFVGRLVTGRYQGLWYGIDSFVRRQLNKNSWVRGANLANKPVYITHHMSAEDYRAAAAELLMDLATEVANREGSSIFAYDEGYACMHPDRVFNYFPADCRMVVVMRDPRDMMGRTFVGKSVFPPRTAEEYVEYQRAMLDRWHQVATADGGRRMLCVRYEDFIQDYEAKTAEVLEFLGIEQTRHVRKLQVFKPEESAPGIGLRHKFLTERQLDILNRGLKPQLERFGYSERSKQERP